MSIQYISYLFIINLFLFANDNIYDIKSSPRNRSLGGMHVLTNDISSIFDSPNKFDSKPNDFFISYNSIFNLLNIYHFTYCIQSNKKMNLSFGIVRREIGNNYNTNSAWNEDGYPDLSEIDYSKINNFYDQETGFLISYNKIEEDFILGINFKPNFHSINKTSSIGFQMDLRYLFLGKKYNILLGLDNLLSIKKWDTGYSEKDNPLLFISNQYKITNSLLLFCEFDSDENNKLGIEYIFKNLSFSSGLNNREVAFGFGIKLDSMNINYSIINSKNKILENSHSIGFIFNF